MSALALTAAPAWAGANKSAHEAMEKPIALAQVPKPAVDAAKSALGADPTEAKTMKEGGKTVYELAVKDASGKEKAVHVSADGKILKKEG